MAAFTWLTEIARCLDLPGCLLLTLTSMLVTGLMFYHKWRERGRHGSVTSRLTSRPIHAHVSHVLAGTDAGSSAPVVDPPLEFKAKQRPRHSLPEQHPSKQQDSSVLQATSSETSPREHNLEPLPVAVINKSVCQQDPYNSSKPNSVILPQPSRTYNLRKTNSDNNVLEQHMLFPGGSSLRLYHSPLQQPQSGQDSYSFYRQASFDLGSPRRLVQAPSMPHFEHQWPNYQHHQHQRKSSWSGQLPLHSDMGTYNYSQNVGENQNYGFSQHTHIYDPYLDQNQPASFHGTTMTSDPYQNHNYHNDHGELRKGSLTDFRLVGVPSVPDPSYRKGSVSDNFGYHFSRNNPPVVSMKHARADSVQSDVIPSQEYYNGSDFHVTEGYRALGGQDFSDQRSGHISESHLIKLKPSLTRTSPSGQELSPRNNSQPLEGSLVGKSLSPADRRNFGGESSMGYDSGNLITPRNFEGSSMDFQSSPHFPDTHSETRSPQVSQSSSSTNHQIHPLPAHHNRSNSNTSYSSSARVQEMYSQSQQQPQRVTTPQMKEHRIIEGSRHKRSHSYSSKLSSSTNNKDDEPDYVNLPTTSGDSRSTSNNQSPSIGSVGHGAPGTVTESPHFDPKFGEFYNDDDEDDDDYDNDDYNKENVRRDSCPDQNVTAWRGMQPHFSSTSTTMTTQHASLRRRRDHTHESSPLNRSLHPEATSRPLSLVVSSQTDLSMVVSPSSGSLNAGKISETDMEQHLNRHKKGLFGKKIPVNNMLTWSKDPIQKPMIRTKDKNIKKEACEMFKHILLNISAGYVGYLAR